MEPAPRCILPFRTVRAAWRSASHRAPVRSTSNGSTGTSGDTISTEKVKSIVTDRAGVSGTFRELKLERDDGRTVYEGEMRSGRTDYEFTIDAYTGAVLEWDTDWDD